MGFRSYHLLSCVVFFGLSFLASVGQCAHAQDPDCAKTLEPGTPIPRTAFILLPRGGQLNSMSPELGRSELAKLRSHFQVRWHSVDSKRRLIVSEVRLQDHSQWLERLRSHPRVVGIHDVSDLSVPRARPQIDRQLTKYMRILPVGTIFKVMVSFPDVEAARSYMELLMGRKLQGALTDPLVQRKIGKPIKGIWVLADRIDVLLETSNDRMAGHLAHLPGLDTVRAELVSAY